MCHARPARVADAALGRCRTVAGASRRWWWTASRSAATTSSAGSTATTRRGGPPIRPRSPGWLAGGIEGERFAADTEILATEGARAVIRRRITYFEADGSIESRYDTC